MMSKEVVRGTKCTIDELKEREGEVGIVVEIVFVLYVEIGFLCKNLMCG